MDSQVTNYGYYDYNRYPEVEDKIKYLRTVKANILVRAYVNSLISNLYIRIENKKRGYASEMIKDEALTDYSYEATSSIIPFFKENSEIIRGLLVDDNCKRLEHSWIKFCLHGKNYIFDPSFNIIVPQETYEGIFLPESYGSVGAFKVKSDILDVLANGEQTDDDWKIVKSSNDINSSFYRTNMYVKGEDINKKILTLTTRYHQK